MAESRAKRMQVVLLLAERNEQDAGKQLGQQQALVAAEEEQLRQLDDYANQYLKTYAERRTNVRPQELIAYSGFIQRLAGARKEQQAKLERACKLRERLQQLWQIAYHKRESLKNLILRLQLEEGAAQDKRLQKELDELVAQQFSRNKE